MESIIKKKANNISYKLIDYLENKKYKFKHYNITTLQILLNIAALINLLYNEFPLFILLFFTSYNCSVLYDNYVKKYNKETQFTQYYNRFGNWLILFTTLMIFVSLYQKKITKNILLIFILLCCLNLIHYMITLLYNNYNNENYKKITNNISKKTLEIYGTYTKYFDEYMTIIYLIILMIYIHI